MDEKLNMQIFDLLDKTGLTWTVNKKPLVSEGDLLRTGSHGLFRSDNNQWLSTVSDEYIVLQNWEMAQIIMSAGNELGLETTRGGQLKDGLLVYLQLELPPARIGKSEVQRLLSVLNSYDRSRAVGFGSTSTVVVCQNTFNREETKITI